jgi:hypothetical protein
VSCVQGVVDRDAGGGGGGLKCGDRSTVARIRRLSIGTVLVDAGGTAPTSPYVEGEFFSA